METSFVFLSFFSDMVIVSTLAMLIGHNLQNTYKVQTDRRRSPIVKQVKKLKKNGFDLNNQTELYDESLNKTREVHEKMLRYEVHGLQVYKLLYYDMIFYFVVIISLSINTIDMAYANNYFSDEVNLNTMSKELLPEIGDFSEHKALEGTSTQNNQSFEENVTSAVWSNHAKLIVEACMIVVLIFYGIRLYSMKSKHDIFIDQVKTVENNLPLIRAGLKAAEKRAAEEKLAEKPNTNSP